MVLILLVLFLSFVINYNLFFNVVSAVGGGGGGGGGGSSGGGDSRPIFSSVNCDDSGIITFQMRFEEDDIIAININSKEEIKVLGSWDAQGNFKSKKLLFPVSGEYSITNTEGETQNFTCPGLNECLLSEFKEMYCNINDNGISAGFNLVGMDIIENDLKFNFKIIEGGLSKSVGGRRLSNFKTSIQGNGIVIESDSNLDIKEFEVVHTKCIGNSYLYGRISCVESGDSIVIEPNSLKCGGLLNIEDRVRCRLNLESEKEEYDNFFPEECRNHKDSEKCLQIYRNVSECWNFLKSNERISCLQEKIGIIKEISVEKEECNNNQCKEELNDKIFTMIKLRFYNLEEQGEILEERGLLDKEDLISFVVEIENKKLEFNGVKTKEDMRKIIQEVKDLWEDLVGGLLNE